MSPDDRISKVEATQEHIVSQMDRMIDLLERTVRLEERAELARDAQQRLGVRVEALESSMVKIKALRDIMIWSVGLAVTSVLSAATTVLFK